MTDGRTPEEIQVTMNIEMVPVGSLKPHPRNYREHPDDQVEHLMESIREHGMYRNIVVSRDGFVLAGHGVLKALTRMGLAEVPVRRLDVDANDVRALKVLTADNEIPHLAEIDDRMLSEILKEIKDVDIDGLLGTGFDDMMLANLLLTTRPQSEIAGFDDAAQWVGMPEYEFVPRPLQVVMSFRNEEDRQKFAHILGLTFTEKTRNAWWPYKEREDLSSLRFEETASAAPPPSEMDVQPATEAKDE
jgi:hypothetical protein